MKFSVGYQLFSDDDFINEIIKRKKDIAEIYFSWGDFPNGRNNQLVRQDMYAWEAQSKQISDLESMTAEKIQLNLLLNATCYGKDSQSRAFFEKVGDTIDYINSRFLLTSITTTSPLIAGFVKDNFSAIDVRASVNMCVGSVEGMEYVKNLFDSFYLKRELNRDFSAIRKIKKWCDDNGKKLYALANSGCLNNCPAHTFHDNLVSHESEISIMDNGYEFKGICSSFLKDPHNLTKILDCTGFIRPEDTYLYDEFFSAMKLATRVNTNPTKILKAYIDNKKHIGSTLDLLEPNHTAVIYPYILENSRIEESVSEDELRYLNIENALIKLEEDIYVNE